MIKYLGNKLGIHYYINRNPNNMELQTWIDGFKVMLLYLFSVVILLTFGVVTNYWFTLILNIIVLCIMRSVREGRHYSMDQCLFLTNGLFIISSLFSKYLIISDFYYIHVLLLTLLLTYKTIINKRWYVFMLYVSCIISSVFVPVAILTTYICLDYVTFEQKIYKESE